MEEPSAGYLRDLAAMAQDSSPEDAVLDCEAALLSHLAGYAGADFDDLRTKVATEYAELFVGPRHPLAGCYGSLYIGFPNRMFTESTRKVRKFYRAFGRMSDSPNRVPDDHIAYELEFMSYLCEQEASALERGADNEAVGMRAAQQTLAALAYLASGYVNMAAGFSLAPFAFAALLAVVAAVLPHVDSVRNAPWGPAVVFALAFVALVIARYAFYAAF